LQSVLTPLKYAAYFAVAILAVSACKALYPYVCWGIGKGFKFVDWAWFKLTPEPSEDPQENQPQRLNPNIIFEENKRWTDRLSNWFCKQYRKHSDPTVSTWTGAIFRAFEAAFSQFEQYSAGHHGYYQQGYYHEHNQEFNPNMQPHLGQPPQYPPNINQAQSQVLPHHHPQHLHEDNLYDVFD
jgi:hypothetical protein